MNVGVLPPLLSALHGILNSPGFCPKTLLHPTKKPLQSRLGFTWLVSAGYEWDRSIRVADWVEQRYRKGVLSHFVGVSWWGSVGDLAGIQRKGGNRCLLWWRDSLLHPSWEAALVCGRSCVLCSPLHAFCHFPRGEALEGTPRATQLTAGSFVMLVSLSDQLFLIQPSKGEAQSRGNRIRG